MASIFNCVVLKVKHFSRLQAVIYTAKVVCGTVSLTVLYGDIVSTGHQQEVIYATIPVTLCVFEGHSRTAT